MRPTGNRILIKPRKQGELTAGGIVAPEAYRQRDVAWDGFVMSTGPKNKLPLNQGDRVMVNRYSVTIIPNSEELWLAKPEDILAVLEEK